VTSSEVLSLDLAVLGQIRSRDPSVALALAREVMRRSDDTARELRVQVRGSVRDRTVRHLLDLAATVSGGDPSMIEVSHERLAEAIGSRREVVSRALSLLERQGLIQLERGRVSILDPSGLKSALEGV
jgi:CRP-like cAMP-binding protein